MKSIQGGVDNGSLKWITSYFIPSSATSNLSPSSQSQHHLNILLPHVPKLSLISEKTWPYAGEIYTASPISVIQHQVSADNSDFTFCPILIMRFTRCSWNATSILYLISANWSLFLSLCFSHLFSTPVPLRVRLWVSTCLPGTGVLLFIPIWWLRPYSLTQNTYYLLNLT